MMYFIRELETLPYHPSKIVLATYVLAVIIAINLAYKSKKEVLDKPLALIMFISQVGILIWFVSIRKWPLKDSLPLYYCRISAILLSLAILLNKTDNKVVTYFSNFSMFGATVALLVPDPEKYNFPHITNISYVVIHGILLYLSIKLTKKGKIILNIRDIILMSLYVLLPINIVNILFKTNYSYTKSLPVLDNVIPYKLHLIAILLTTILVVYIVNNMKLKILNGDYNIKRRRGNE